MIFLLSVSYPCGYAGVEVSRAETMTTKSVCVTWCEKDMKVKTLLLYTLTPRPLQHDDSWKGTIQGDTQTYQRCF